MKNEGRQAGVGSQGGGRGVPGCGGPGGMGRAWGGGCGHLPLEVTVPRVVIFRQPSWTSSPWSLERGSGPHSIAVDLFAVELGTRSEPRCLLFVLFLFLMDLCAVDLSAEKGLRHTPKNVSGAIISIKASYAERIQVLLASWKSVTAGDEDKERGHEEAGGRDAAKKETAAEKKKTGIGSVLAVFHNIVTNV